jgi:phytol kinase
LYNTGRPSLGEVCFPLAVALVYLLAHGEPHAYVIPLLLLTLADPAAALVGTRCGHTTDRNGKTFAGSLAFFIVALVCSAGGLLLTGLAAGTALAVGGLLAGVTTEIERRSRLGLDNLFVPVGSCILLRIIT